MLATLITVGKGAKSKEKESWHGSVILATEVIGDRKYGKDGGWLSHPMVHKNLNVFDAKNLKL